MEQGEDNMSLLNAHISIDCAEHVRYEGRVYRYLNKHRDFDPLKIRHVTILFARLPPVSKIVNYDSFKAQLERL